MDPLVKWAGGKRQLLDPITALLPKDIRTRRYHEPMVGGGALFFRLEPTEGSMNDANPHLIRLYHVVRDDPDALIEAAKQHENNEDYYYKARKRYNQASNLTDVERAALFLYFNRTAFNGLWRVNLDGGFNVPYGSYSNPTIVNEKAIRNASDLLARVTIREGDFEYITKVARAGDVIYFDPPYQPVSETESFTQYTKGGFDEDDQRRLSNTALKLHEKGAMVILSNSYAKPVRDLYEAHEEFEVQEVDARRAINSDGNGRGPVKEILVHNSEALGLQRWA